MICRRILALTRFDLTRRSHVLVRDRRLRTSLECISHAFLTHSHALWQRLCEILGHLREISGHLHASPLRAQSACPVSPVRMAWATSFCCRAKEVCSVTALSNAKRGELKAFEKVTGACSPTMGEGQVIARRGDRQRSVNSSETPSEVMGVHRKRVSEDRSVTEVSRCGRGRAAVAEVMVDPGDVCDVGDVGDAGWIPPSKTIDPQPGYHA